MLINRIKGVTINIIVGLAKLVEATIVSVKKIWHVSEQSINNVWGTLVCRR